MQILFDIILSLFLIIAGYVYVCCYCNDVKLLKIDVTVLKPTKNKVLYLAFACISIGVLIALFQIVYHLSMLQQTKLLILVLFILPAAAVDLRFQKIPNQILVAALVTRVIIYIAEFIVSVPVALNTLKDNVIGAAVIGAFFLLLLLIFRNSIGMGDIKLFAVMGLYQGLWGAVNSVFFSLMVSFVLSIALLITKKKSRKDTISFGPSVLLGTVIAIGLAGM